MFVCLYCDKTLGSKRTVRMHITNLHKANPDSTPLMYQQILVSPTNVKKILSGTKSGIKVINVDPVNVAVAHAGQSGVNDAGSEPPPGQDSTGSENVSNLEPEQVIQFAPGVGTSAPPPAHSNGQNKLKKKRKSKVVKVKEKTPGYDFRRLASLFSLPEFGEDFSPRSGTVVRNPVPIHIQPQAGFSLSSKQPQSGDCHVTSQPLPGDSHVTLQPQLGNSHGSSQYQPGDSHASLQPQLGNSPGSSQYQPGDSHASLQSQLGNSCGTPQPLPGDSQGTLQPHLGIFHGSSQYQPGDSHATLQPQLVNSHGTFQFLPADSHDTIQPQPQPGNSSGTFQPQLHSIPISDISEPQRTCVPLQSPLVSIHVADDQSVPVSIHDPVHHSLPTSTHVLAQAQTVTPTHPTPEQTNSDCDQSPWSPPSPGTHCEYISVEQPVNPRRAKFSVPYKKRPRGKCGDWETCSQCSLDHDCGECRNCQDKSLQ